jgi:hypothetical protein
MRHLIIVLDRLHDTETQPMPGRLFHKRLRISKNTNLEGSYIG